MEGNELYNFSISPVVTAPFALEWSEDNHVSLITLSGIHIFEFVPHPTCIYPTLKFWRTFIHTSSFSPVEAYSHFINKELWRMKREEIYTLLLEESITPCVEDKVPPTPRITRIAWSPKNLADPCRCLAAMVTSAGSVEILKKCGDEWFSVWNLTEKWCRRVEKEGNIDPATATIESFLDTPWPEHARRLLGTAIAWSPLGESAQPYAYLAAAFASSEIVVARVEKMGDALRTEEPRIVYATSLKSASKIAQLAWIAPRADKKLQVLAIGYADGRIHGFELMESEGKLAGGKLAKYQDRADRMAITSFRCVRRDDGNLIVLATKASCLVAIDLDAEGERLGTRYLKLPAFSITGATVLSKDKILLTAQNAKIFVASIPEDGDLTQIPLEHDLKSRKVQYFGVAASPNRALLLNVTSPNTLYDHLTIREPSNVQILWLKAPDRDVSSMIMDKYEKNVALADYWDCVEAARIIAAKSDEANKVMPATIPSDLDGLSIEKLRLVMWLTMITEILDKKQLLKGVDKIIGEISEAQPLIFLESACSHLERLSRKKHLDSNEKRSACFLRMFMEIYLAGEDSEDDETRANSMTRKITRIFRDTQNMRGIETENCNLCGEILSDLPWTIAACPKGHKLPRCSVSLLQITSIRYRSCKVCERLFHPSLDKEYEVVRCIYCDLPADYDSRVSTPGAVSDQWQNLSKRPACHNQTDPGRNPETETSASTSETTKRRGIKKPKTFAVVVSRDEDDDPLITETWQKF